MVGGPNPSKYLRWKQRTNFPRGAPRIKHLAPDAALGLPGRLPLFQMRLDLRLTRPAAEGSAREGESVCGCQGDCGRGNLYPLGTARAESPPTLLPFGAHGVCKCDCRSQNPRLHHHKNLLYKLKCLVVT